MQNHNKYIRFIFDEKYELKIIFTLMPLEKYVLVPWNNWKFNKIPSF